VEVVDTISPSNRGEHVAGGAAYIMVAVESSRPDPHTAADNLVFGELDGSRFTAAFRHSRPRPARAAFRATLSETIRARSLTIVREARHVERDDDGHAIHDRK